MDKTNENLSIILKSFNKLDNYIAKYIYKKYIENVVNIEPVEHVDSDESDDSADSIDSKPPPFKYSKKPINQEEYTKYIHTILFILYYIYYIYTWNDRMRLRPKKSTLATATLTPAKRVSICTLVLIIAPVFVLLY